MKYYSLAGSFAFEFLDLECAGQIPAAGLPNHFWMYICTMI